VVKPICVAVLFAASAWPLFGQVDRVSLNGTVSDASGAVILGAKVVVVAPASGLRRETVSGANGSYNLPGLPIGTYNITVSAPGFEAVEAQGLTLKVGQVATYDARLTLGTLKTQVDVTSSFVEVNRTSAEIGGVVGAEHAGEFGRLLAIVRTTNPRITMRSCWACRTAARSPSTATRSARSC
jgi:hypothetical protein